MTMETPHWKQTQQRAHYTARAKRHGITKYQNGNGLGLEDAIDVLLTLTHANELRQGYKVPLNQYRDDGKPPTVAGRHAGRAEHAMYNQHRTDHGTVRRHLQRCLARLQKDGHPIPESVHRVLKETNVTPEGVPA